MIHSFHNRPLSERGFLLDIDNTLTNSQREITADTREAVRRLEQTGATVSVCTGRGFIEVREHVLPIFSPDSVHVFSGGAVVASSAGEIFWERVLPHETVFSTCQQVVDLGGEFGFSTYDTYAGSSKTVEYKKSQRWKIPVVAALELADWSTPLFSVSYINDDVETFVQSLQGVVLKRMLTAAGHVYYDITPEGVTKAQGAQKWSEVTGIPLEHVTAVGDGANDEEVLAAVGWGVAMGNALESLKLVADEVIGHTDDNGLAEYLLMQL